MDVSTAHSRERTIYIFSTILYKKTGEGVVLSALVHGDLGSRGVNRAAEQTGLQVIEVQVLTNEDDFADTRFVRLPGLFTRTKVDLVMHTLEDKLGVTLVGEG